jgi:hypothetical protein
LQEQAAAQKRLEELQASQAGEARRVWVFLGQTEAALVPLGFNPLHSEVPTEEVDDVLPLLDKAGAKLFQLEEVIDSRQEEEGPALAEVVAEHVLLCFYSWNPQASLEHVVQRPRRLSKSRRGPHDFLKPLRHLSFVDRVCHFNI